MKKIINITLVLSLFLLVGCSSKGEQNEYELFSKNIFGPFDTITTYMTYAKSEDDFNKQYEYIYKQLEYYDQLFDKYTAYDDFNNVNTINKMAGIEPVVVESELIDVIQFSIENYKTISSKVNIAFGSVIKIWHDYREEAESNDGVGEVPTMDALEKAALHTSIESIIIDEDAKTVYINDAGVSLDLGATAKGYAIELIKQGLIDMGVDNFLLSGGGNVASHGERKFVKEGNFVLDECKDKFCVGIESPKDGNYASTNGNNEAILVVSGESIVTSGDYQRFYEDLQGVKYHHLIDPDSLFPAVYFRSVSIITPDSGMADFLSSAVFLMPYEDGLELIESLDDVEAIWLLEDGKVKHSSGLKDGETMYVVEKDRLN